METYNACIHVEGVYSAPVLLYTLRVHVRAVPVLLKICTTPILLGMHPVSVLLNLKI